MTMPQAIQALAFEKRRAFMLWLTQHGPFWEDSRKHGPDDWIECNGSIVTDSAVGEAAWCCLNGIKQSLVSLTPSSWEFSPVPVDWVSNTGDKKSTGVVNHWTPAAIEAALQAEPAPLISWSQLDALAIARCTRLTFAADAFAPLNGLPFVSGAAQRLLFVLETLNRFKSCFDVAGQRTPEGHEIYHDFFTGKKEEGGRGALFSDSSDEEKSKFRSEMTFQHPADNTMSLFCSWHGKVQTPQLRVHFSWPIRADEPVYVVYVGPKITKQ
ncbi:hypothetical protein [Aromatoleum bremense]|nr:hypothetical protein [Aromatoleum bremense]